MTIARCKLLRAQAVVEIDSGLSTRKARDEPRSRKGYSP